MLDVIMPAMDGFGIYDRIRKLDDKVIISFLRAADMAYYEVLKKHYPNIKEDYVIRKPVDNESSTKTNKISIVKMKNKVLQYILKHNGDMASQG